MKTLIGKVRADTCTSFRTYALVTLYKISVFGFYGLYNMCDMSILLHTGVN